MDIKLKTEPLEAENLIKEENELILESEWFPTKFKDEESEYYHEFVEGRNQDMFFDTVIGNEHFTIEYLDENNDNCENDGNSEDEEYAESDDTDKKNFSDEEDGQYLGELETNRDDDKECSSASEVPYHLELNKWVADNYVDRECPVCSAKLTSYNEWRRHITLNHKESIEESESNYYFGNNNSSICKKCHKEFFLSEFFRFLHTGKHSEEGPKLNVFICKICNFRITKRFSVSKHFLEKHAEVVEEFKKTCRMQSMKCPLCPNTYVKRRHLWYHFMDEHPNEHKAKLRYTCHLCKHGFFREEEVCLQHLMEKHSLNSWKILNYRKIFDDKDYFACADCNNLFFQNDTRKLLSHFLKHENNFSWSCTFCSKKFHYKFSPLYHMCNEMMRYYEKHCHEIAVDKTKKSYVQKIKNLQEFEEHVAHVCPFCNKEFAKMLKWQHHLKAIHKIDTLKGLQMKVVAGCRNKLTCIVCRIVVANSPEQLHAHRFTHLPYKPYKCLSCLRTLNNFKMAATHVLNRCEDEDTINRQMGVDFRSIIEMQCSVCNYQKISDVKHFEDDHNNFEEFFIKHADNTMTCKVCGKNYVQYKQNSCFMHLHHHFDEKTFKCKLCPLSYCRRKGVFFHVFQAHNAKPLNEQSNEKNTDNTAFFMKKENKITNITKLSQIDKNSIKSYVLNEFAEFISYACPECNEGITTYQSWFTHITTQHHFYDEANLFNKEADGSLKCPTCRMTLNTSTIQQQRHKLTHLPYRSFICNLCYVRCNSLGVLYGHFRNRHFAQGAFKCPICSEILQTEHGRTVHIKEVHPRDKWPESMCLICYKILATKSSLIKHQETHDADRFRFSCDVCGAKILASSDFAAHMNRHRMRDEIKEKLSDDITSQATCNNMLSKKVAEVDANSELKHTTKRKSNLKSTAKKKKNNSAE